MGTDRLNTGNLILSKGFQILTVCSLKWFYKRAQCHSRNVKIAIFSRNHKNFHASRLRNLHRQLPSVKRRQILVLGSSPFSVLAKFWLVTRPTDVTKKAQDRLAKNAHSRDNFSSNSTFFWLNYFIFN